MEKREEGEEKIEKIRNNIRYTVHTHTHTYLL